MKMSWICASSESARHQLQRSLMLGFAHARHMASSSPAAPGSRHARSGSSRQTLMSNGCSHGGDLGAYSNARMFNSGADACSKAETRCSAVSRSAGDAENISGDFRNDKSQDKWPLLASQVEPMISSNGGVASEDGELLWSGRWWARPMDTRKQIFCNRSLNMRSIEAIGFDMDYTLAQYKAHTFESLAYVGTIQKLVHDLKYPAEVSSFSLG